MSQEDEEFGAVVGGMVWCGLKFLILLLLLILRRPEGIKSKSRSRIKMRNLEQR